MSHLIEIQSERAVPARLTASERAALRIVGVAMAGFGAYGMVTGASGTVAYLLTVAALGALVARLRTEPLPHPLAPALAVLAAAHLAGGLMAVGHGVLYNASLGGQLLRYDHLVHASGAFLGTVAVWVLLVGPVLGQPTPRRVVALCVLAGLGLGALNETVEFLSTLVQQGSHVGGYANTGWDLVSNVVGALGAGLLLTMNRRPA